MTKDAGEDFIVIGAGLAGSECALALASQGFTVRVYEQKPNFKSAAHVSDNLAELVCSNSLRSNDRLCGVGLLKEEMRSLKSPFMAAADACRIPAGKALAVDRVKFSEMLTRQVRSHPRIVLESRQIENLEAAEFTRSTVIVAAGPMASAGLAESLGRLIGEKYRYFYDAIAPVIWTDTLDFNVIFRASRYGGENDDGDYLNAPMSREEYDRFHAALLSGQTCPVHAGEEATHFEGCLPIETLAARDIAALTFGPLKPVGLTDPRTGQRPYAVLQLRAENTSGQTCNLVGCQTKLLQKEQERIFRLVPGMENVEFSRYGSMHRNTYVNAPAVLDSSLAIIGKPNIHLAGQITGVEGYVESAACGLWLGLSLGRAKKGDTLPQPPEDTALGALLGHLRKPVKNFQPANVNFGLMPPLTAKRAQRKELRAQRAENSFREWLKETNAHKIL